MPKATAHRIIAELVDEGMLERGERGLRLGLALFVLGTRVPRQLKFRDLAFPYAEQLHRLTHGSAFVFIADMLGPDMAPVDAVRRAYRAGVRPGAEEESRISFMAAAVIFHAYGVAPAPQTRGARVTADEPAGVLSQGFAVVRGTTGAVGVAAPVLIESNAVVGALAVVGPHSRVQSVKAASHVRAACAAVSRVLQRTPELAPVW